MITNSITSRFALLVALIVIGVGARAELTACGDKFVMISRGTRFQRPVARRTAAILIYAANHSASSAALADGTILAVLRRAGYHAEAAASADALDAALRQRTWNLILVDVGEIEAIRPLVRVGSAPILLPVVSKVPEAQLKRLKKEHRQILKVPARTQTFVDAVDAALAKPL